MDGSKEFVQSADEDIQPDIPDQSNLNSVASGTQAQKATVEAGGCSKNSDFDNVPSPTIQQTGKDSHSTTQTPSTKSSEDLLNVMSVKEFDSATNDGCSTGDVDPRSNAVSNGEKEKQVSDAPLPTGENNASSASSGIFSLFSDSTANSTSLSPASSVSSVEMLDLELNKLKPSTKFAYATLVAVLLGDCCRCKSTNKEIDEPSSEQVMKLHEKFLKDFVQGLKTHLELPESIEHTLYSHANIEDGMSLVEDYVSCILMDPHFETHESHQSTPSSTPETTEKSSADVTVDESSPDNKPNKSSNKVVMLVLDALQCSIRKGKFDSRSRETCIRLSKTLGFTLAEYEEQECGFVDFMQNAAEHYQMSEEEKKAQDKSKKKTKRNRYLAIGLAAVGGGALIGLTGGIAAPFVAGGIGALIGGAGAAVVSSTAGLVVITSIFGTGGAGLVGYKMKRRVGDIEQFEFTSLSDGVALHVAVAIPGWLREGEVIAQQYAALDISPEQYCLLWDTKYLLALGNSLQYLKDMVVNAAMSQALKYTVLSTVMSAIAWPAALLSVSSVIDNPWSVANSRSELAGKQMSEVLLTRQHGCRPVTLVGVSLGAKIIYQCLLEMATRGSSALGIIHNIVLIGAPCSGRAEDWVKLAPLVSGKIINAFSQGDWMLKFIYRSSSMRAKIAGLGPIPLEPKIVNVDLTEIISGHLDYLDKMAEVLAFCGVKNKPVKVPVNRFSLAAKNRGESGRTASGHSISSPGSLGDIKNAENQDKDVRKSHSNYEF